MAETDNSCQDVFNDIEYARFDSLNRAGITTLESVATHFHNS